jgi:hypothetical protein
VVADATEYVWIWIAAVSREAIMLLIEHLRRRCKFDGKGAHPADGIIFVAKTALCH